MCRKVGLLLQPSKEWEYYDKDGRGSLEGDGPRLCIKHTRRCFSSEENTHRHSSHIPSIGVALMSSQCGRYKRGCLIHCEPRVVGPASPFCVHSSTEVEVTLHQKIYLLLNYCSSGWRKEPHSTFTRTYLFHVMWGRAGLHALWEILRGGTYCTLSAWPAQFHFVFHISSPMGFR